MKQKENNPRDVNLKWLYKKAKFATHIRKVLKAMKWTAENFVPLVIFLVVGGGALYIIGTVVFIVWTGGFGWIPLVIGGLGAIIGLYFLGDWWSEKQIMEARRHGIYEY